MKDKIMPALVLTIICTISALLLVVSYESTKESIAEQKVKKFGKSISTLFGECNYTLLDNDFDTDGIEAIAITDDEKVAIQMCVDGYSKDGINILIGINENGEISGIEFVSLGETPGLGTKVRDVEDFREQFIGAADTDYQFDAVSGATYSSKGMKKAVDTALNLYNDNKEAILDGKQ